MKFDNQFDMPDAVFLIMLSWLDTTDLARVTQVNREWNQFISQDAVWRRAVAGQFRDCFSEAEIANVRHLASVKALVRNSFIKGEFGETRVSRTVKQLNEQQKKLSVLRRGPERQPSRPVMVERIYFMATPVGGMIQKGYSYEDASSESFFAKASRWASGKITERKINKYQRQLDAISEDFDSELTLRSEVKRLSM